MRTLGFLRNARKHTALLAESEKRFFQNYVDGINAYIETRKNTYPLEFKLAGIQPTPWTVADSLAIGYFMSWNSSANVRTEIIAQMLVEKLGEEKAREIFPLNINPDHETAHANLTPRPSETACGTRFLGDSLLAGLLEEQPLRMGSNNWVVGPGASPGGKPILANDPHLDPRLLPGPWYPCGLVTPEFRFVGVGIPGVPGLIIGRNNHIAVGVTNAYGDVQDLYVETVDPQNPGHYMEGESSLPFEILEETLKIRDKKAPGGFREEKIQVRLTHRGPVVSGVMKGLKTERVITLRWAPFETMGPELGLARVLGARSVAEIREILSQVNWISLNFVFADTEGNIGWHVSGKLPIRSRGDGTVPFAVRDGKDNWVGWIPFEKMPHAYNPKRGWIGTCNHYTVPRDYPHYFTSHVSPSYRYRRLVQLLDAAGAKSANDHWRYQRDATNLMAKVIAPIMAKALAAHEDTAEAARILSEWDCVDDPEKPGPALFQAIYRQFALAVFEDELGPKLARLMLGNWYFWQERLQQMVVEGTAAWFDDVRTKGVTETRDHLFHRAALAAFKELKAELGGNLAKWKWGKIHQMEFVSPIRRKGFGKGLMGAGSHPMGGSGETLYRGLYEFNKPYNPVIAASLRMVADLADPDKVLAILPGGVTARVFGPHTTDQTEPFMKGEKRYWWFSDKAIQAHCKHALVLDPR
ncbi:MAG: penicillin acylase family protein [Deltaproteobacteria bacterium]|nr:penicillin acylase family protein [Deltaproteobacteria bacterium]MBW2009934.1 penicillin acylase family protein [Deltaproteobacteria bacterium]